LTSPATPDYAQRLKVAGQAIGTDNPQLAQTLATSGLTPAQIQAVGGFSAALNTNTANQLAIDSGVPTNWTTAEQNQADAIGTQLTGTPPTQDNRNWLEKAAGTISGWVGDGGNFLFHNPVTHAVETGLNWLGDVAHMPFRLLSAGIGGEDTQAKDAEMTAMGYDPSSTISNLAFMFSHGESEYHSLSHVRDTYGDDLVDMAVRMQADPDQFQKDYENMDPQAAADLKTKMDSEEFKQASMAVDALHISPGRDLANILLTPFGVHTEDNEAFKLISGVADAAYDWMSDPTLILGRVSTGMRAVQAMGGVADKASLTTRLLTKVAGGDGALAQFVQRRAGGLADALDKNGIFKTLGVDPESKQVVAQTIYSKAWQSFLDKAAAMRDQTEIINSATASAAEKAAATTARAQIYTQMSAAHPTLMPLLDEVNGARVVGPKNPIFDEQGVLKVEQAASRPVDPVAQASYDQAAGTKAKTADQTADQTADKVITDRSGRQWNVVDGKPITELHEMADYLANQAGLLRLTNGEAAAETMVMPGRVSWWGERMAARKANKAEKWINYVDNKLSMIPVDEEHEALSALDPADADMSQRARLGQAMHNMLRTGTVTGEGFNPIIRARARMERLNRRVSTVLPNVRQFDLTDPSTVKDVEQFARFYLDKGQARMLAAAYAAGDLGTRRAVVRGMVRQSMHAAGLGRSPAGRKFMDDYLKDVDEQAYGLEGTDLVQTDRGPIHGALYHSQLSTTVPMPSLKQMNQMAVRYAVDSWASKTGLTAGMGALQSNRMDALYGHIKMGWITSAAGGLRNALDEVAGFLAKGMGRQVLQGRVAYTQATEAVRKNRVVARKAYKDLVAQYGAAGADDYIAQGSHAADQGVQAATRAFEQAVKARDDLANIPAAMKSAKDRAAAQMDKADQSVLRAKALLDEAKKSGDTAAIDRQASEHADALDAQAKARDAYHRVFNKKDQPTEDEFRQALLDKHAKNGILSVEDAKTQLDDAVEQARQARLLETAIQHRIPYAFRRTADTINHAVLGVTLGKMLRVMGPKWAVDEQSVKYAQELQHETLRSILSDGVQQTHYADNYGAIAGPEYAMDLHRNGIMARRYSYKSAGWGTIEPDGGQGMDAFAKYLALRFANPDEASHAWLAAYRDTRNLGAARDAVRAHLDTDAMRPFIAQAEVTKVLRDGTKVTTPELLARAKDELADRISADLMHGLIGRHGEVSGALLDHLAEAREIGTPDASWILHNVPEEERPAQTIGQLWAAHNPAHTPGQMPRGYAAMMSKVYGKMVTDYVDAASRNPLVTALYINARRNTESWEKFLVEEKGWNPDAAAEVAQKMALSHAEQESYKHIDNPHVASQFSLISRNFLTFERAQEDWLRRWGRAIKDNPSIIRKGQLAVHAGTSTGMVEQDPTTGQLNFVYPGSQLAIRGFNALMRGMGLGDQVQIPILGELTSQLTYLSPSLAQPFGTSASPIISIPFKAIANTVGQDHQLLMSDLDTILNGQMGAGQNWYSMILPPSINRIIRGWIQSDPASQYGQAYAQAAQALGASGAFDKLDGNDPTAISNVSDALGAQIRSNMVLNTLFGFFAPAAPAVGNESHGGAGSGTKADWSAHMQGYNSLQEEAQKALADLGPTRFRLWWAATHPHELAYDPTANSHTTGGTANAFLPATLQAAVWSEQNQQFRHDYGGAGGVAAYFIPSHQNITGYDAQGNPIIGPDTTGQNSYNAIAYRAQLQDHARSYKPLQELIPDLIVQRGETEYYAAKDDYDARISAAKNSGDTYTAKQLTAEWSQKKQDIYAHNPLLAEKNASYATNGAVQAVAVGQLRKLVDDHSPSTTKAIGDLRGGVQILLDALDQYNADDQALSGRAGSAATMARAQLRETYAAEVASVAQQYPDLADLVKGVFRTP
jgi:hypothetical protein